jgi:hypothetical protein
MELVARMSLLDVLKPAFRCDHFDGVCRDEMKWCPETGYVPRGFGGANPNGSLDEVRLVIVTAEPSDPVKGETYEEGPADTIIEKQLNLVDSYIRGMTPDPNSRYADSIKTILNLCFHKDDLDAQLRRTWFTNAVKCSAQTVGGKVSREIERACAAKYLKEEIRCLPNAYVLALGGKAQDRLKRAGIRFDGRAQHPSARPNTKPKESWKAAADEFQAWLVAKALPEAIARPAP